MWPPFAQSQPRAKPVLGCRAAQSHRIRKYAAGALHLRPVLPDQVQLLQFCLRRVFEVGLRKLRCSCDGRYCRLAATGLEARKHAGGICGFHLFGWRNAFNPRCVAVAANLRRDARSLCHHARCRNNRRVRSGYAHTRSYRHLAAMWSKPRKPGCAVIRRSGSTVCRTITQARHRSRRD